jgi:DNA primase
MISCKKANDMDLVDYLEKLGHHPTKISRNDYWYLSPLREEKNASFKVNRKLNLWYDHGTGNGGNLVDFGTSFHNCSVKEFLSRLSGYDFSVSFHQHLAGEKKKNSIDSKIKILSVKEITSTPLLRYLKKRNVDPELSRKFCKEILFELYNKKYRVIGFENNSGGYELRSENFKGSSAPKDIRFIGENISENEEKNLLVFEGFFSFLSYKTLDQKVKLPSGPLTRRQESFLILNSLSFFEKSRELMEKHDTVRLFLDHDRAGIKYTENALKWSAKYKDESLHYNQYKDLNEYLTKEKYPELKESREIKRSFRI